MEIIKKVGRPLHGTDLRSPSPHSSTLLPHCGFLQLAYELHSCDPCVELGPAAEEPCTQPSLGTPEPASSGATRAARWRSSASRGGSKSGGSSSHVTSTSISRGSRGGGSAPGIASGSGYPRPSRQSQVVGAETAPATFRLSAGFVLKLLHDSKGQVNLAKLACLRWVLHWKLYLPWPLRLAATRTCCIYEPGALACLP